jgi:hypothetical protein
MKKDRKTALDTDRGKDEIRIIKCRIRKIIVIIISI